MRCISKVVAYLSRALHPMQLSRFLANFIMPLFDGVDIEMDLVWLPQSSSLLAFLRIGSNILNNGYIKEEIIAITALDR